jgi:uncharacterized membrane protein
MNEQEQAELAQLKARQARLEQELASLSNQLKLFEDRLKQSALDVAVPTQKASRSAPPIPAPQSGISPEPVPPAKPNVSPAPPVIRMTEAARERETRRVPDGTAGQPAPISSPPATPVAPASTLKLREEPAEQKILKGACQVCQGEIEFPTNALGSTMLCPRCGQPTVLASGMPPIPPRILAETTSQPVRPSGGPAKSAEVRSFEMRLGTYWLVRIGIVMVLTGLVFFGNLAYQNYISQLGPGGKVCLLYLASAALLGAGWWWQRQAAKESLKNYAQVLFAGGLAALYFTTYAAHYVEPLKIIQSPLADGVLLLACAGFMVWIADRKKSEVLALFAVGLAYYTSIITRVGSFTLYSNLVLTVAAVCFLVRNRWAALSFGSLVATYAAYGFWRFFDGSSWHWASPEEGLWSGTYFLISYWVVFTSAVFLSKHQKFAGQNRATFLTLNNGAFFTMFLLTMLQVDTHGFWKFALIYGGSLLVLAELSRRSLPTEPLSSNSYLTQGVLLVTVGFISKFAGLHLALILAAESIVLLLMGQQRQNLVLTIGAYLAAGLAVAAGIDGMRQNEPAGVWLAMGLGAFMVVNTLLVHRQTTQANALTVRPQPAYFTVLALVIWLVTTWDNTSRVHFPLVLAIEGVLLTLTIYVLRIREITFFSQGYLVLAQLAWVWNWIDLGHAVPWSNPALLIALSLGLSHWWQKQKALKVPAEMALFWQGVYALAIVGLLYFWLSPKVEASEWLVLTAGLAIGLTAYGVITRAWFVASVGQLFVAVSVARFAQHIWEGRSGWAFALAPMFALGLLSWGTVRWFERRPDARQQVKEPLLETALIYRWVALVMSIAWICDYVPARERIWLLSLVALWVFLFAGLKRSREALLFSAAYTVTALALFWLPLIEAPRVYWPNLVAIVSLLTQRQIARRLADRYVIAAEVHTGVILIGGLSVWLFVSRWVLEQASGFYLTASWSLLALAFFTIGILLRERVYRWLGLGVLACAIGRVVISDVWKLETLYRILSFMALGIVLLVLGFIYNKYQEKIREWL